MTDPSRVISPEHSVQLAIETTTRTGSIAVLRGPTILHTAVMTSDHRTAAALGPEIAAAIAWCRTQNLDLGFISIADGPGSFTGLRIGVTAAKTLAYALELPLVAVDSLASIAAETMRIFPEVSTVCVALDAYRRQVYRGSFQRSSLFGVDPGPSSGACPHGANVSVVSMASFLADVETLTPEVALAGDAKCFGPRSDDLLGRQCDAAGVGWLAWRAAAAGRFTDPMSLVPRYLKVSAAEEKQDQPAS